jgi:Secretion system C-terminal sorting domain
MKTSTLLQTKMLFFACYIFVSLTSVKAQSFSLLPSGTQSMVLTCDSVDNINDVFINNTSPSDLTLSYQVVSNTLPSSSLWSYLFCDWNLCYTSIPTTVKNVTKKIHGGSDSSFFALHITSNNNAGGGKLVVNLWETNAPSNSVTITWYASASAAAGVSEHLNNTGFITYPNPAADFVNVEITSGYSKTGSIQVYNFVGEKLMEFNGIKNNVQKIDLTKLPSGAYFVKYNNGESSSVKKIFKTR